MQFIDLYEHGRPFSFSSNYANKNYSGCSVHWHDYIELLYTYSGNSIIRCDSTIYNAKAGDLVVINSNELHNFHGKERSCIRFNKAFLPEMYQNNKIFKSYISNDKKIIYIFEKLDLYHKEIDDNKYKSFDIMGAMFELAEYLLKNYQLNEEEKKEYFSRKNKSSKILAAFNHISNNYNEKIPIKLLAEKCFLSEFLKYYTSYEKYPITNTERSIYLFRKYMPISPSSKKEY